MSKMKTGGRTHIASKDARKLWKAVKQLKEVLSNE
mgnify:CR=1 FL=1